MKRDGTPHKDGFVHRTALSRKAQNYSMGGQIAVCGVRKVDGYSIHPARKLTSCPECKRLTKESMESDQGSSPNVLGGTNAGAAS